MDVKVQAGAVLDRKAAALAGVNLAMAEQQAAKAARNVGAKGDEVGGSHCGVSWWSAGNVIGVAALDAGALVFGFGAGAAAVADGCTQLQGGA